MRAVGDLNVHGLERARARRAGAAAATLLLSLLGVGSLVGIGVVPRAPAGVVSLVLVLAAALTARSVITVHGSRGSGRHFSPCLLIAWLAIMGATALLLVAFTMMARRSKVAGWAAMPIAISGSVIALAVARATALLVTQTTA